MGFIHGEIQKEILALFIRSSSHKIDTRLEWTLGPQASCLQVNWDSASPQGWSSQIDKLHTLNEDSDGFTHGFNMNLKFDRYF